MRRTPLVSVASRIGSLPSSCSAAVSSPFYHLHFGVRPGTDQPAVLFLELDRNEGLAFEFCAPGPDVGLQIISLGLRSASLL